MISVDKTSAMGKATHTPKIPKKLAQVFHLKMIVEEDSKIICEMLDITDANYWVILHRAKIQLRSCLFKNWVN